MSNQPSIDNVDGDITVTGGQGDGGGDPTEYAENTNDAPVATIRASLEEFLLTIDTARNVLKSALDRRDETPPTVREIESHLSVSDKRHARRIADEVLATLPGRLAAEIERIQDDKRDELEAFREDFEQHEHYPLTQEFLMSATMYMSQPVWSDIHKEFLAPIESEPLKLEYAVALIRLGSRESQAGRVARAIVPLQIDAFAQLVRSLMRIGLLIDPNGLGDMPPIPRDIYRRYGQNSLTFDIDRWSIDQIITATMELPSGEWLPIVSNWLNLETTTMLRYLESLVEVVARCRLLTRGGIVDEPYLADIGERFRTDVIVGMPLIFTTEYAESASISIETAGLILYCHWHGQFPPKMRIPDLHVIDRILNLERHGRWQNALDVANAMMNNLVGDVSDTEVAKINRWFCLQQMGLDDVLVTREIQDWNPSDEHNAIGKCALLRDYDGLHGCLRMYISQARLPIQQRRRFARMPLLQRAMSESSSIRSLLEERNAARMTRRRKTQSHRR